MREEIGTNVACGNLLWVLEKFFTYAGRAFHEVVFYYFMSLPDGAPFLDLEREHAGREAETPLVFRWFLIDRLGEVCLYPTILRTALRKIPASTQHLIHIDE